MLTFFRTNQPFANILLLVYLAILRASTFIHPTTVVPRSHGIWSDWMLDLLPPTGLEAAMAAFLLVFVQAVIVNLTIARYRVATEISLFPGVFYCLIMCLMPDFLPLSSVLMANTFLILAVYNIFDAHKNNYVAGYIFDAGVWLGVASLFHFSYILFLLWGIVGLAILRGIRLQEVLIFLIGFIVPLFLAGTYCFWIDKMPDFFLHFKQNIGIVSFVRYSSPTVYVKFVIIGLLVLVAILASTQFFSRRNMTVQKYISILYWLLFFSGTTVLIQSQNDLGQFLVVAIPLGILLSMTFQRIGRGTAEALHLLLLMIAFILQFEYLLI